LVDKEIHKPFIGNCFHIEESTNKSNLTIKGIIVDETKNSFIIEDGKTRKTILKKGTIFFIDGKKIHGDKITKRLEDRIKSRR
jgi:RNase P/RNase MRP subunit p29